MNCEKYQEMISCLLDGELCAEEQAELEQHMEHCPECRAMYDDFAAVYGISAASAAPVPDSLHENIMAGIKAAAKKKNKPIIIRLRPYMAAAACLVVVVGAAFSLRGGISYKSADSATAGMADCAVPMDSPAEMEDEYKPYGQAKTESTTSAPEAEVPESAPVDDMAPDSEEEARGSATLETPADEASDSFEMQENGSVRFIPNLRIDSAFLTQNGNKAEIEDLKALSAALEAVELVSMDDFNASAQLEIRSGDEVYMLELCFSGDEIYVRQGIWVYRAAGSLSQFLEIK